MASRGNKIKHYEILRLLGKGGMGEVYLAHDTVLDREVAIKFLPETMQKDVKAKERFLREAKSAAALDHPFICKIYETGEIDGKAFIVMEYVEGENLREKMKEGPIPLRDTLRVALEASEALEKAHEKGIVHRDLKPDNIMLTPQGHVKVMDFGLAKRVLPTGDELSKTLTQASVTEHGTLVGTMAYMSPEQAKGDMLDLRSDIFSLGIILYEMISAEHPFLRPSPVETLSAILRDTPPSVHVKLKKVHPAIDRILEKTLAKDPRERYPNVADLAIDIRNVQREIAVGSRLLFRGLPIFIGGILIIAIVLTGIWWFVLRGKVITPPPQPKPISVLISDFQNQTGDPVFDGALEQLLGISLEGASFISIYERAQARELANQLDPSYDGRLTAQLAQLISNREGINVVVDASIEPSGDGYIIRVWALDPAESEKIAEASRTIKTKAEVGKAVDYLSAKLRSKLGDIQPESAQAFAGETFTASSLAAMNAYARGQELMHTKREEAINWFLKAIDNDPNLGRAYAGLASVHHNLQQHDEAEKYYLMALARIDQMTEREKHRTQGGYYLLKRNYPKAIEEFGALAEKYPADTSGYTNLAFAYFFSGNMVKAAEVGRHAVELNPNESIPRYNLVWYTMAAGDFDTAEQEVHALIKIDPEYWDAYVCKALVELAQGLPAQAAETYRYLKAQNSYGASLASTGLADLAFYEGRLSDTKAILEKGIAFDLENGQNFLAADKYIMLAQTYQLQGKSGLALEATDRAVATFKMEEVLLAAAQIYVQAGQEDQARDLAGELSKKIEPGHQAYAKMIGGELSMARGDFSGAVNLFLEAQGLVDTWISHFLLGRAYLEAKAFSEAYSEFDKCLKRRGEATSVFFNDLPTYRYLPPVYYYLGRAQEGLNSDAASDSYQAFLIIREKGDGDWMVDDARRRLNSL